MISLAFVAACLTLVIFYQQSVRYIKHRSFRLKHQCYPAPRFPQYERLIGIDLMLENLKAWKASRLLDQLRSRFQRVGNTYRATIAGNRMIFTVEPENIRAIFADQFNNFDSGWVRRRAFAPAIGDVLITADGPRWHQQRAMLRPAFNKQQFSDFQFYERDIDDLIRRIPNDGSTIDLASLFPIHALTVASRLLFDEPMATLNPEFATSSTRFIEAFNRVNKGNEARIRMGRLLPFVPRDREFEAGCNVIHQYGDVFVQKALSYRNAWLDKTDSEDGTEDRYVFLRELAKEIDNPLELRNHLLGMLLVGSETTANLLTGCLSLLSSRPDLWERLRKEAIDLGVPSSEGVKSFTSLSYVINEGRRT